MKPLTRFIAKYCLAKVLSRKCGNTVPRSEDEGQKVNCYYVSIEQGESPLRVESIDNETLSCIEWDGNTYSILKTISLNDVDQRNFVIRHFYGLADIKYSGIFDFLQGRLTLWPYIKIHFYWIFIESEQFLFNKKKLVAKQRIDLLKLMLEKKHNGVDYISSIQLMSELHSDKWILHPNGEMQHRKIEFYLDSLADTGELRKTNLRYGLTGYAIKAIEEYEEQERKHKDNVKMQWRMFWVALLIAILTVVQVGLIKLPPLIDFSDNKSISS